MMQTQPAYTLQEIALHAEILVEGYANRLPVQHYDNARFYELDGYVYVLGTDAESPEAAIEDWMDAIDILPEDRYGGVAHSGFCDHVDAVLKGCKKAGIDLTRAKGIFGHSLGGTAAEDIGQAYGIPWVVWGTPNCWLRPPSPSACGIRIWNKSDPVVSQPPRALGWEHIESEERPHGPPWWWGWLRALFSRRMKIRHFHWMGKYRDHAIKMAGQK